MYHFDYANFTNWDEMFIIITILNKNLVIWEKSTFLAPPENC